MTTKQQPNTSEKSKKRRANESLLMSDPNGTTSSDSDIETNDNWFPSFLVAQSTDGQQIKLSIFGIQKLIKCAIGEVKSAKKLRNGSVLIEVCNKGQAERAMKLTNWVDQPITITPHRSLNTSRGIIRCPSFKDCADEEVLSELKSQGVVSLKRFVLKKDGNSTPTGTFILNFNTSTPPTCVKAAYMNIVVEPFIPGPLRCYNCQKYGHGRNTCNRPAVCSNCGQEGHQDTACHEQLHCINCSGNHSAHSKQCPEWTKQQEISRIKYERKITFKEAKLIVEQIEMPAIAAKGSQFARRKGVLYSQASQQKTTAEISTQTEISWPSSANKPFSLSMHASIEVQTEPEKALDEATGGHDMLRQIETHTKRSGSLSELGAVGGDPTATVAQINTKIAPCSTSDNMCSYIPIQASTPKAKIQLSSSKPGPASSKPKTGPGNKPSKGSDNPVLIYNKYGSLDQLDPEVSNSPRKGSLGPGIRK